MSLWTNSSEISILWVKHKYCPLCSAVVFSAPCPLNSSVLQQHYSLHIPNIHFRIVHAINGRLSEDVPTTTSRDLAEGGSCPVSLCGGSCKMWPLNASDSSGDYQWRTFWVLRAMWKCRALQHVTFVSRVRNKGWIVMQDEENGHMLYVTWLSAVKGRDRLKLTCCTKP